ncbi:molybdopterin-dependent oxidoreductase [uncultured Algoriphagus sp.]|mgnify:CR=1 FL=1|uniref:molybdopterin-dependent oxidoreductase n=1 Tax=uncultured Algoriphagus sp. TaxID=417365 RepID=UPI0030ED8666|tara:strand:- start:344 stop:850 length:507 start_codon:yes stop_codon:yes gene_type:complete
MNWKPVLFICLICIVFSPEFAVGQIGTSPSIIIEGEVLNPLKLSIKDLVKMQSTQVKVLDMQGKEHVYKGVMLVHILDSAGVTLRKELRGKNLTKYLLLSAPDGYQVVYSLAEIDPEFTDSAVIVAYEVDGHMLPSGEGPFRIVASKDKKPARWIRELTAVQVLLPKD